MKQLLMPLVLWYLRIAARVQLKKHNPLLIGIAGSSGKTSLVELIGLMLSDYFPTRRTKGENSETGIPLHILGIPVGNNTLYDWFRILCLSLFKLLFYWPKAVIYVIEMGIDSPVEPKNMSYLLKIVKPFIGVVTNVSLEHSLYFEPYITENDSSKREKAILALTAEQETMLLTKLPRKGYAVVNLDDESIGNTREKIKARQMTISLFRPADLQGKDIQNTLNRFSMIVEYDKRHYPLTIHQPLPRHFAYEFLCTIAVGLAVGLSIQQCIESLQNHFSLPAGRLSFFKGIKNTTLIDSSYNNATLPPIIDILHFVTEIAGKRRKIAILGDMRELGEETKAMHEILAKKIIETVDYAILIGPFMRQFVAPLLLAEKFPAMSFETFTEAKDAILSIIGTSDVVLVKGSQNTLFLERVVEMLLADKKNIEKLTRRGEFWDKKRSETL